MCPIQTIKNPTVYNPLLHICIPILFLWFSYALNSCVPNSPQVWDLLWLGSDRLQALRFCIHSGPLVYKYFKSSFYLVQRKKNKCSLNARTTTEVDPCVPLICAPHISEEDDGHQRSPGPTSTPWLGKEVSCNDQRPPLLIPAAYNLAGGKMICTHGLSTTFNIYRMVWSARSFMWPRSGMVGCCQLSESENIPSVSSALHWLGQRCTCRSWRWQTLHY
jgi:hypothetical protein